jgi:2-iminoacetate synthase ThiH
MGGGDVVNAADLLALREDPPALGRLLVRRREPGRVPTIEIQEENRGKGRAKATLLGDSRARTLEAWPSVDELENATCLLIRVEVEDEVPFAEYLIALRAELGGRPEVEFAIAPFSLEPGGTHRLWAIGAARLALPPRVRVQARHDLIGIRIAQIALAFGADIIAGPVREDRSLPVAGVTRPTESSPAGLDALIRQAGFEPVHQTPRASAAAAGKETQ